MLSKRRRNSDEDSVDTTEMSSEGAGEEVVFGPQAFNPLYLQSVWKERKSATKRLTLAILLPSEIISGEFSLRVADGGEYLELTIEWPKPLVDPDTMHRKWLCSDGDDRMRDHHPKLNGFEEALKSLRSRMTELIESTARIPLPFPVQTHFESKRNLLFQECGVRMLYVDLKAFVEDYAVVNDEESFEVV